MTSHHPAPAAPPASKMNENPMKRLMCLIAWGVKSKSHKATTNQTRDGDGDDPREEQETNTLPVDSLEGTVAKTDTNGGTSDAHGCGDGELVLGEDEGGDGGAHLHGRTTGWRVVGELVTHDLHDVVSVGDETDTDGQGHDGDLPRGNILLRLDSLAGLPCSVHTSPDTDGVSDIVGAVSERCGTGSDDLDERVEVLDLVLVLGSLSRG